MHCPNPSCQHLSPRPQLLISERSGIEIDYCPSCRGVWLDRGELDKLIERAQQDANSAPVNAPAREPQRSQEENRHDDRRRYEDGRYENERRAYDERKHYEKHNKYYDSDHKRGYDHYGKPRKKSLLSEIFDF